MGRLRAVVLLAAVAAAVFNVALAWLILAGASAILLFILFVFKLRRAPRTSELSDRANDVLRRHASFYEAPLVSRFYAHTAIDLRVAGVLVVLIGLFHMFWWGFALGVAYWVLASLIARAFFPYNGRPRDVDQDTHEEIVQLLSDRVGRELWDS